jgi:hypothetical protein
MAPMNVPPLEQGWSLFVVELIATLEQHNATLRSLERLINKSVVQRLVDTQKMQNRFTVPNPADFAKICDTYSFQRPEKQHLIAALLATSIQQKLTERFGVTNASIRAREAAYAILPFIEQMVIDGPLAGFGDILKHDGESMSSAESWMSALAAIDRGNLALYTLTYMEQAAPEYRIAAHEAYLEFHTALNLLDMMAPEQRPDDWGDWQNEAERGQQQAIEYGGQIAEAD